MNVNFEKEDYWYGSIKGLIQTLLVLALNRHSFYVEFSVDDALKTVFNKEN